MLPEDWRVEKEAVVQAAGVSVAGSKDSKEGLRTSWEGQVEGAMAVGEVVVVAVVVVGQEFSRASPAQRKHSLSNQTWPFAVLGAQTEFWFERRNSRSENWQAVPEPVLTKAQDRQVADWRQPSWQLFSVAKAPA